MAKKLDMQAAGKYLLLGASAAAVPVAAVEFGMTTMLANIPMWTQTLWGSITAGGIVLAGLGVGLVDQLVYNK